ncbi:MAG: MFS transporter [Verrucomicrobia subdivision 3 bacterium]|nr:MFS transporter [Limisphaerales bacterium]
MSRPVPDPNRTAQTFRFELWRAATAGIIETAGSTFLLLIAVRYFDAGALSKATVAAAGSLGLLISPAVVSFVNARGWPVSQAAARILAIGAAAFLAAAIFPPQPVFVIASVVAMASSAAIIPLLTQMYQENYPEHERGRRFSRTVMIRIATAAIFAKVAGDLLTAHMEWFRGLLVVFGAAFAMASYCLRQCPTHALVSDGGGHPLRALRFVQQDALFRRTLVCWMLMGFANLMMLPLRVEYLAHPRYGLTLKAETIALLTAVIPNLARLCLSPVWGHLFDRMNFFALRVTLNVGFAIGIVSFFTTDTFTGMVLGAVIYGISNAGGDVAWSLWVTKFAPPDRVADYMSVHTFLTGIRGVLAPVTAFYVVTRLSLGTVAWMCSGLIVLATLILVPEIGQSARARRAAALVEEVSE